MPETRVHTPTAIGVSLFWILLFVGYALYTTQQPPPQPIELIPPTTSTDCITSTPTTTPTPAPLRVYVSGAVTKPGVYRLPPDSLVVDAIQRAGGARPDADLIAINLAHPLQDGEQIYVPRKGEALTPAPITRSQTGIEASATTEPTPIDINTASQEALESLPGIGPTMARRIIQGRPYASVEDLLRVKGIGEARLEKLRPYITVR